jgi:hypothetical protein
VELSFWSKCPKFFWVEVDVSGYIDVTTEYETLNIIPSSGASALFF